MSEVWMNAVGFEGIYMISDLGRVKSLPILRRGKSSNYLTKERFMNPVLTPRGYYVYKLRKDGADAPMFGHRMVAQAFIPNPENKPQVNHINSIKTDNSLQNLEWVTNGENQLHAYQNGKVAAYKNKFGKNHNQSKPIMATKEDLIIEFENISRASEYMGCSIQNVSNALRGLTNKCMGFSVSYL